MHGWTPLIQASVDAEEEEVAALLKYGADVNAQDEVYDCLLCVEIYTHTHTYFRTIGLKHQKWKLFL
jgi:hypothetical protein